MDKTKKEVSKLRYFLYGILIVAVLMIALDSFSNTLERINRHLKPTPIVCMFKWEGIPGMDLPTKTPKNKPEFKGVQR